MSLYTPASAIRRLILEAEELTLAPNSGAQEAQQFSDEAASPNDIMSDMSASQPPAGGAGGTSLTLPNIAQPPATTTQVVVNSQIILSQLGELKALIVKYEKDFDKRANPNLSPETSTVMIGSLLEMLVVHAKRLNEFIKSSGAEITPQETASDAMSELPGMEEAPEPMPEAAPEMPEAAPEMPEPMPEEQPSNVSEFAPRAPAAPQQEAMPLAAGRSYRNKPSKG